MPGDGRTRKQLVAEIDALRKRVAVLEARGTADHAAEIAAAEGRENQLRRMMAQSTDLICEVGVDGSLLFVSPNAEILLGVPAEQLIGRSVIETPVLDNVHPDDRDTLASTFRQRSGSEILGEFIYRYRVGDGWRWFASRGRASRGPDGEWTAVVVSRDVTEREKALEQLRSSEERHRVLVEATHDLIAELDAEGRLIFVSPSCQEVLGYTPEEMIGTTPFALLHPDDGEQLADRFVTRVDSDHRPGMGAKLRVRHRDGSWRWLEGGGVNFRTSDGATHVVAVTRDITARIEAEEGRRQLERRVQQAERFESMGMLATGVAHDFNNLLTPILGAAGLAMMDLPEDSPVRARLEKIQRAAHRAAKLTNQLLEYSGRGAIDPEPVRLPELLSSLEDVLRGAVSRRVHLLIEPDANPTRVEADPSQLGQLVTNLVTNASDGVEAGGQGSATIVLRTGSEELDRSDLARLSLGEGRRPGRYAWLEVEDDGRGMDEHTRARVFDPFFTTKYAGRGLGLAVALGIVRKHRGVLELESERNQGTRIRIYLPAQPDG